MTKYYECHITLEGNRTSTKSKVEAIGWKFSAIDGDPVLGDGVKCYATKHYNERFTENEVTEKVCNAAEMLQDAGMTVTRRKVELVIFDDRSTKVKPE